MMVTPMQHHVVWAMESADKLATPSYGPIHGFRSVFGGYLDVGHHTTPATEAICSQVQATGHHANNVCVYEPCELLDKGKSGNV